MGTPLVLTLLSLMLSGLALGYLGMRATKPVLRRAAVTLLALVVGLHLLVLNNKILVGTQSFTAAIQSPPPPAEGQPPPAPGLVEVEFADIGGVVLALGKSESSTQEALLAEVRRRLAKPDATGKPRPGLPPEKISTSGSRLKLDFGAERPADLEALLTAQPYRIANPPRDLFHVNTGIDLRGGVEFACRLYKNGEVVPADDQIIFTLQKRLDGSGLVEPQVFRLSSGDVQVVIPGGTEADAARTRVILQTTGKLEVREVLYGISDRELITPTKGGAWQFSSRYENPLPGFNYRIPPERRNEVYPAAERSAQGSPFYHLGPIEWTGEQIQKSNIDIDGTGDYAVSIRLNATGAALNEAFTRRLKQDQDNKVQRTSKHDGATGMVGYLAICMDGEVVSAPIVREASGGATQITGNFDEDEAQALVDVLNAGALTVTPRVVSERVVGPSLGQETIAQGTAAMLIASLLVVLAMFFFYHLKLGLVANISLLVNVALIFVVLSIFQATLTLPGLAGMVLTVGMAVDANILIFERLREENTGDLDVSSLIAKGYDRAFGTILDSNLTTFVVALILYAVGSGPIKGFGLTLMIGIATTLFSAVFVGRMVNEWLYRKLKTVKIRSVFPAVYLPYTKYRFLAIGLSVVIGVGSWAWFFTGKPSLDDRFGVDFTGGHQLQVNFSQPFTAAELRRRFETALAAAPDSQLDPANLSLQGYFAGFEGTAEATRQWMLKGRDPEGAVLERQRAGHEDRLAELNRELERLEQLRLESATDFDPAQKQQVAAELATTQKAIETINAQLSARKQAFQAELAQAFAAELPAAGSEVRRAAWKERELELELGLLTAPSAEALAAVQRALQSRADLAAVRVAARAEGTEQLLTLNATFTGAPLPSAAEADTARTQRLRELLAAGGASGETLLGQVQTADIFIADASEALAAQKIGLDEPFPSSQHFSPLVGDELWKWAIIAMIVANLAILAYVAARFEFRYGVGAIFALAHDVILTIGLLAVFDIQIDLTVVAALLTIIGYSINDTIVIFDRIREYVLSKDKPLREIIDEAVGITMSRTLLTTATVMITVLVMFFFGGEGLRAFSGTLIIGLILGTYSTVFIASPVLLMMSRGRPSKELLASATEVDQDEVGKDGYSGTAEAEPKPA
jgi:SecD/SecF fusion protein